MRGRLIGERYELGELLGSGGMGEVWRARDLRLDRAVAVKILLPERGADGRDGRDGTEQGDRAELLARFRREARVAASLDSPYIVAVHDHGDDAGSPYLVMALVEGRALHQVLRERGRVPVDDALRWVADVCRGLAVAHDAGVVHRDIKPANIMVTGEGPESVAKVVDFGIAKFVEARSTDPQLTRTGQLPFGSVLYMAPERFRGGPGDGRIDLYALGCVLYELLVGRPPFVGDAAGVMYNHLHDEPLRPSRARSELTPGIDRLVLGLMAKDPDDRPVDARAALEQVLAVGGQGSVGVGPVGVHDARRVVEEPKARNVPEPEKAPEDAPVVGLRRAHTWRTEDLPPARAAEVAKVSGGGRPRRSRLGVVLGTLVALLAVGIPVGVGIGGGSSEEGPGEGGGRSAAPGGTGAPDEGYTIGVAYDWGDDEDGRIPKVRKQVVDAALKEAARRAGGKRVPVRAVPVEDYRDTPAEELLERHPGMLAIVGDVQDFAGVDVDYSQEMAVLDTCGPGPGDPGYEFATPADDVAVGKAAGRYLSGAYGVHDVLIGSDSDWTDDDERDEFPHGLRKAGLRPVATELEPYTMDRYEIARDMTEHRPDAVTVSDLRTGDEEDWVPTVKKYDSLVAVRNVHENACEAADNRKMFDDQDRELPDGAVRFRTFYDEELAPDCASFPKLCTEGRKPRGLFAHRGAAELYDGTLLLAEGIGRVLDRAGEEDPDRLRAEVRGALARVEADGVLGHYAFKDNQAVDRPVWVDRRVDGRWRSLGTVRRITG
ncbi:protein kinase [Streptomyces sp. NPDC059002]|uniref:protein kinase domain-containing protein n=1 Tax=Streptomyces sp. NPDC059002 TaxID=3346690 RepID=UPI0036A48B23